MKKFFTILMFAATLVACARIEQPEPVEEPTAVADTYSLIINATKGDDTKALVLDGKTLNATWDEGEIVEVYQSGSKIGELTAAESSDASTTLTGSFASAPSITADLTFYFHSAADPTYGGQDGTLETIASKYDFCAPATVTVGNFTVDNVNKKISVPGGISFGANRQAIVCFKLKNKAGNANLCTNSLRIGVGTNTYSINRQGSANPYYVAIPGFSGQTISLIALDGDTGYEYIKSGVSFANGQYYEIAVKMDQVLAMTDATASSVGKVIATDGKMYTHVRTAELAGTTASGIVAYVGSAGSVESGSNYKGLAIAMRDAVLTWGSYPNHAYYCSSNSDQCSTATPFCSTVSEALNAINGIAATQSAIANNSVDHYHDAAGNGDGVARPSGASGWAIPSMGQWNLMAQGLTGNSSNLSDTDNPDYHYNNLSTKINAAGGTHLEWLFYWSSTEQDLSNAWCLSIGGLDGGRNGSRAFTIAKNHNDEYMHVRMFFAF